MWKSRLFYRRGGLLLHWSHFPILQARNPVYSCEDLPSACSSMDISQQSFTSASLNSAKEHSLTNKNSPSLKQRSKILHNWHRDISDVSQKRQTAAHHEGIFKLNPDFSVRTCVMPYKCLFKTVMFTLSISLTPALLFRVFNHNAIASRTSSELSYINESKNSNTMNKIDA